MGHVHTTDPEPLFSCARWGRACNVHRALKLPNGKRCSRSWSNYCHPDSRAWFHDVVRCSGYKNNAAQCRCRQWRQMAATTTPAYERPVTFSLKEIPCTCTINICIIYALTQAMITNHRDTWSVSRQYGNLITIKCDSHVTLSLNSTNICTQLYNSRTQRLLFL